jgi:hypothetical protein
VHPPPHPARRLPIRLHTVMPVVVVPEQQPLLLRAAACQGA